MLAQGRRLSHSCVFAPVFQKLAGLKVHPSLGMVHCLHRFSLCRKHHHRWVCVLHNPLLNHQGGYAHRIFRIP